MNEKEKLEELCNFLKTLKNSLQTANTSIKILVLVFIPIYFILSEFHVIPKEIFESTKIFVLLFAFSTLFVWSISLFGFNDLIAFAQTAILKNKIKKKLKELFPNAISDKNKDNVGQVFNYFQYVIQNSKNCDMNCKEKLLFLTDNNNKN